MKRVLLMIVATGLVSVLSACGGESGSSGANRQDVQARQLAQTFVRLNDAATTGDRVAYQNLFLSEGVMFLPDREPLLGRDAIGNYFQVFRDTVTLVTDQYEQVEINITGDTAVVRSRGTGRYILKETGEEFPVHNKFIDILLYVDGEWLFSHHLASSSSLEPGLWDEEWESKGVVPE